MPLVGPRESGRSDQKRQRSADTIHWPSEWRPKGMVIFRPLRGLHPVKDVRSLFLFVFVERFHPFFLDHPIPLIGSGSTEKSSIRQQN